MAVNSTHPEYDQVSSSWLKARDVLGGEEAVKGAGTKYLPMLSRQTQPDYDAYRQRAMFYNASARTVAGLSGAVMRKPPIIQMPDRDKGILDSFSESGESFEWLARMVLEELLGFGRVGLLVDASLDGSGEPYVSFYPAETIVNWRYDNIEGRDTLSLVVLKERVVDDEKARDMFEHVLVDQYRVLRIDRSAATPQYVVELWRQKKRDDKEIDQFEMVDEFQPRVRGGRGLDFIPFWMPSTLVRPPILDLVNVNLSHYRNSADLEHGRHYTALPTAWVAGFKPPADKIFVIGSQVAWVSPEPNARAGFLEFTGAGLGHLSEALKEKERLMAVLGARLLEEQSKDAEAFETVRLRHSGESSVLSSISRTASEGLTKVLKWMLMWRGGSAVESVEVELNQDFNDVGISAEVITALIGALQSGSISFDTWFYNLQRGEIIPDGRSVEEEMDLILAGTPIQQPGRVATESDEDEEAEEDEDEVGEE